MAKAIRYNFLFDSDLHSYKIECWQEGFTGTPTQKRLGEAPSFVRDKADKGIMGTSLELSIEAEVNDELIDFYTVDSNKFLFKQYIDNALVWQGYLLPEKYSEQYIDAPYDVEVTAADGLGILKGITFDYSGRYTILQILKYILDQTELSLEFEVFCNLSIYGQGTGDCVLNYVTVNAAMWSGKSCYDVLSSIMTSLNAFVTQKDNRWLIARYSDIVTESYIYSNSLTLNNRRYLPVINLGSDQDAIPSGSLNLDIEPAKKSCEFTFPYYRKASFLANYNFAEALTFWTTNGVVAATVMSQNWAKISGSLQTYYLRQAVAVEADSTNYELAFDYIINSLYAYDSDLTGKLFVTIELTSGSTVYKLTTGGWKQTSGSINADKLNSVIGQSVSSSNYTINKKSIVFSGFPASGTLVVSFQPDASLTGMQAYITNVSLNKVLQKGLKIEASMALKASEDTEVSIDFLDTPFSANKSKILYNHFEPFPSAWIENSTGSSDTFINTITRDYISHLAFPRRMLKGKLYTEYCNEIIFYDVHSDRYFFVLEGTHDLIEEELDAELLEYLQYDDTLEIEDVEDWIEGEETSGTSSGSSGGSSGSSGQVVDALTIGSTIAGADSKSTPGDTDNFGYSDTADSSKLKKFTWAQLKSQLQSFFNSLYAASSHSHTFDSLSSKPTTLAGYGITNAYTKTEVDNKVASVYKYKGSVASFSNLPTAGVSEGDVYNVTDTGMNCAWTGSAWDSLGATYGLATQSANGLMSSTDKTKLDNATSTSTADTIVKRDSTGKISVNSIEINGWTVTID